MATAEDERALLAQRDRDLGELYPTQEAWERSYPPTKRPDDPELRQQYDDLRQMQPGESQTEKALNHTERSADVSAKRQRELDAHDRMMMRGAAEASRDALHDNGPGKEPGAYTVQEARDRAAHTPPAHRMEPDK